MSRYFDRLRDLKKCLSNPLQELQEGSDASNTPLQELQKGSSFTFCSDQGARFQNPKVPDRCAELLNTLALDGVLVSLWWGELVFTGDLPAIGDERRAVYNLKAELLRYLSRPELWTNATSDFAVRGFNKLLGRLNDYPPDHWKTLFTSLELATKRRNPQALRKAVAQIEIDFQEIQREAEAQRLDEALGPPTV
jgi:hypothetical protein